MPLTLRQATVDPRLRQRLLDIHRQVWLSLLWGHCSVILNQWVQGLSVPSNSLFPQSREVLQLNPLAIKVKFPGFSLVPLPDPQVRQNLLSALELLQQCKNFFHTIVP